MEAKEASEARKAPGEAPNPESGLRIDLLSLFPDYFQGPLGTSILGRARDKGIVEVGLTDLRGFGEGRYRKVDDRPYGGGPGMVLMAGPLIRAIRQLRGDSSRVIGLTPQGKRLTAGVAQRLSCEKHLIVVCGHYEGFDERVSEMEIDEELSIGDVVLTNGCLPALVLIDAVARFVPGVLAAGAAEADSFQGGLLEGPHYTRPESVEGEEVPSVLRSGDHRSIDEWRRGQGAARTARRRPDLFADYLEETRQAARQEIGVQLWVNSLTQAARFYQRVLGWDCDLIDEGRACVKAPGLGILLLENPSKECEPQHLWVVADSAVLAQVRKRDYPHRLREMSDDMEQLEICDPDGHLWSIGLMESEV